MKPLTIDQDSFDAASFCQAAPSLHEGLESEDFHPSDPVLIADENLQGAWYTVTGKGERHDPIQRLLEGR